MKLKAYILSQTNTNSFRELKTKLKAKAKYQYGCYYAEIKCEGFTAVFTSNPNHYCRFMVKINGIGMVSTFAFDRQSITKAGKKRGCAYHFLQAGQLKAEVNFITPLKNAA